MHRKVKLDKALTEWLDLQLATTCVRADQFTRYMVELKTEPNEVHIINRRTSKVEIILGLYDNKLGYVTGYDEKDEFIKVGIALWVLQAAVEQY